MGFLQSKQRSRLLIDKMDKLCFIYINTRSLNAAKTQGQKIKVDINKEIAEELANEDLLLNQEDDQVRRKVEDRGANFDMNSFDFEAFFAVQLLFENDN